MYRISEHVLSFLVLLNQNKEVAVDFIAAQKMKRDAHTEVMKADLYTYRGDNLNAAG